MRYGLVWALVLGLWSSTQAQTITITDQDTQKPIEGVFLLSQSVQASAVTNAKGQADLSAFRQAEDIRISHVGYQTRVFDFVELQAADFRITLVQMGINLDQVIVSATRWRQSSSDIPSKIVSVSPEEVALQNPQTAADLLGVTGKVFIQKSQQGGGSPMIRGFATNRLIYTVDGVRMNNAIFRGGNLQNVISLDPFAIEHTEVMFGPGSVIYGSDAIGGVMAFQTYEPQLSLDQTPLITGKAVMRYSSANQERTGHLDVNVGWKKWALVTSFSSWDFDHLRQGSFGPQEYLKPIYVQRQDSTDVIITQDDPRLQIPSAYSQMNLMQKVRFKPNERWDVQYGFHYSTTSPYGRYDRHNRYRNGTLRYAEWSYGPQLWQMHNLSVDHQGNNALYDHLSLRLAQQRFEESRIDRTLNRNTRTTNAEAVLAYSVNVDLTKNTGDRNTLFYGVEYVSNDVLSTGLLTDISTGVETAGPSRYPHANWTSLAAYLNDQWTVSERLSLQGGLRYNHFLMTADFTPNQAFYPFPFTVATLNRGALTGSAGVVYRPAESWVLKANLGTAFRAPNVDDIGKIFDSEPGTVTVPNPDLQPEYAYNVDLALAKVLGGVVKVDLTAYYTVLQNAMVRRNYTLNGQDSILYDGVLSQVQAIQNAATANVYGVQGGVEVKLPSGFTILSDLNWQRGTEEMDDGSLSPSRHAAPLFGVSRVRYQTQDLTLELNARYQGERSHEELSVDERGKDEIYAHDANGNTYAPAWYTLNLKATYQLTEALSFSSGIENLTDQRYRPYSSGISGAGRNFVISLRAGF